jgi:hypothetical protein
MSSGFRISIGANLVLLALVGLLLWRGHPPTPATVQFAAKSTRPSSHIQRSDDDLQPPATGAQLTPAAIAELKRAGFSSDAIAESLIDDHTFRYDKRVRALQKKYAPKPVPRREMLAVAREGEAERIRELKAAMSEDGYRAWDREKTLSRVTMGRIRMTADESERVYQLQKAFEDRDRALKMAQEDGTTDPATAQAEYDQAQKQLDHDMEALLGKDRTTSMHGASDPVADVARRFQDLNPSPEQAQAVIQAESDVHAREAALVQRLKDDPGEAANLAAELKALTDSREQSLRQIFGSDSYDNAKRENDTTYQKLTQYASAWNLADSQIQPVYDAVSAYHDQADRMRMAAEMSEAAGRPVNWRDVNVAITQSRLQTESALVNLIGGEQVHRLQENGVLDVR